jgi:hypothetical protein
MYQIQVYPIVENVWRWEVRRDGTLIRCGTAHTWQAAERDADEFTHAC